MLSWVFNKFWGLSFLSKTWQEKLFIVPAFISTEINIQNCRPPEEIFSSRDKTECIYPSTVNFFVVNRCTIIEQNCIIAY